jgi:hypothetical protein
LQSLLLPSGQPATLRLASYYSLTRHTNDLNRKRGEYIVPGPNFIWSIDGHDKLAEWGFQIYGGIDAYARKII